MAIRTISNTGGNWNATSSWVEGIVPVASDDVIATSTSGNLVVNVGTGNLRLCDFSNYLGTLTLNNSLNIGGIGGGFTSSFSATMSFATSTSYSNTNAILFNNNTVHFIRTNGNKLPWVVTPHGGGACPITLLDDLNATTLSVGLGNQATTITGTYSVIINHFVRFMGGGGTRGYINSATTANLKFVGPTASYSSANSETGGVDTVCIQNINMIIDIGATGTFSLFAPLALFGTSTATYKYTWQSGILHANEPSLKSLILFSINDTSSVCRLDFATAGTWSNIYYNDINTGASDRNINLISDLYFDNLEANPTITSYGVIARRALLVNGSGALKGGTLTGIAYVGLNTTSGLTSSLNTPIYSSPMIKLVPGPTHSLSAIKFSGHRTGIQFRNSNNQVSGNSLIMSSTASVRAKLNFTGNNSTDPSLFVQYTDIDASIGNTIYNYGGSYSNSLNIGSVSFGGSVGGGESAFAFIS